MSDAIEAVKEWVETIREDVAAIKAVVESAGAETEAREFAATALNYVVTKMDLVPDHNESVGVMDDVMVLRVLADLASQVGLGSDLGASDVAAIGRMTNEVEQVEALMGGELYAKLRTYCARLKEEAVRDRTPEQIVEDPEARAALFQEVEDTLRRLPPSAFEDADAIIARFKSYLHHKLKDL